MMQDAGQHSQQSTRQREVGTQLVMRMAPAGLAPASSSAHQDSAAPRTPHTVLHIGGKQPNDQWADMLLEEKAELSYLKREAEMSEIIMLKFIRIFLLIWFSCHAKHPMKQSLQSMKQISFLHSPHRRP